MVKVAYPATFLLVDASGEPNDYAKIIARTSPDICLVRPSFRGGGRHGSPIEGAEGYKNWTPQLATLFKDVRVFLYVPTGRWQGEEVPLTTIKWQIEYCIEQLPVAEGFFFDETGIANEPNPVDYFVEIYNYVKAKGRLVVLNHGVRCYEWMMKYSGMNCLDNPNPENFSRFKEIRDGWIKTYPDSNFFAYCLNPTLTFEECVSLSRQFETLGFGYVCVLPETPYMGLWAEYERYINAMR